MITAAIAGLRQRFAAQPDVLMPLCAASAIGYLPALTMPWLIGFLSRDMGYEAGGAGAIVTAQLGLLAATTILLGSRIQLVNRHRAAMLGALAVLACGLALASDVPAPVFLAVLAVAGIGCGACQAAGTSLVSQAADPVRMTSSLWMWTVAWQTVVWLVVPLAFERWGGRGLGAVLAMSGLVMLPWLLRMPRSAAPLRDSGLVPDAGETGPSARTGRSAHATPILVMALLTGVAAFWLRDSIIWSLAETRGVLLAVSGSQLSQTLALASVLGILGPLAANFLGDRVPRKAALLAGLVLASVVMQVIATTQSADAYRLGFLFWTATSLFAWTYLMALAAAVDAAGRIVAVCSGVMFAAAACGPLLGGVLTGNGSGQALPVVIASLSVVTIGALVVTVRQSSREAVK